MVVVIKKGDSIEKINKLLAKLQAKAKKGLDAKKFSGTLSSKIDGLEFQKKLRDEWE